MAKTGFTDKVVVIFGATGGLGEAIARALHQHGASLMLVGRKAEQLQLIAAQLGNRNAYVLADITQPQEIDDTVTTTVARFGRIDMVINATGFDVRKPLLAHTESEIQQTININLTGSIHITHAFLPHFIAQNQGIIVHLGGFGDGRLAFPFYSVDVASRAGLHGFIESVNRELRQMKHAVHVKYFGPTTADTEAERPYQPLWQEMGVNIVPPEQIAKALLSAIANNKSVHVMGFGARALTLLNAISPCMADVLILNKYGKLLKKYLVS
ncbi:MAG: SDR family NAD(P)-dependent oxidoreductase [Aggregatilineales bacterium]